MSTENTAINNRDKLGRPADDANHAIALERESAEALSGKLRQGPLTRTDKSGTGADTTDHTSRAKQPIDSTLTRTLELCTEDFWHQLRAGNEDKHNEALVLLQLKTDKAQSVTTEQQRKPFGTWQQTEADGKELRVFEKPDGTKVEISKPTSPDLTNMRSGPDTGKIKIHTPGRSQDIILNINNGTNIDTKDDGSFKITQRDGTTIVGQADGTVTREVPSAGLRETWKADGTKVTQTTVKEGEGTTTTITYDYKDGSKFTESTEDRPDHTQFVHRSTWDKNGTNTNVENVIKRADHSISFKISFTRKADGTRVTEWLDDQGNERLRSERPYYKEDDKDGKRLIGYQVVEQGPKPEDNRVYDTGEKAIAEAKKLQAKLEQEYGITFSKLGDDPYGKERPSRAPTYLELLAVERAIVRSWPAHITANGSPAHFCFLDGAPMGTNSAFSDKKGSICVVSPEALDFQHKPGEPKWPDDNKGETIGNRALVAALTHELAHQSDYKMNHKLWAGPQDEEKLKEYGKPFGFTRIFDEETQRNIWVIQDHQDNIYKKTKEGWVPCQQNGRPDGPEITNAQMRDRAKVTPVSEYFDDPREMLAEALTALRLGGEWKERLRTQCPELYKLAQALDQGEIELELYQV